MTNFRRFCLSVALLGAIACIAPALADQQPAAGTAVSATQTANSVPIIFDDRHVYAYPDELEGSRVLAALVDAHGNIMVPLSSMFQALGGVSSYNEGTKTVIATKGDTTVQVTLGVNEVTINGEKRPLDVAPTMHDGLLLVPVRVISEALGAYVEWLPLRHIVVVRFTPPTPVPTPEPTAVPTLVPVPTPTPTPQPTPTANPPLGFVQAGLTAGKTSNELAAGQRDTQGGGNGSYVAAIGYFADPWAVKVDARQDSYQTTVNAPNAVSCFTKVGGGQQCVPTFTASQATVDARVEYRLNAPDLYMGVSYLTATNNYGGAQVRGIGGGLERLPDFTQTRSLYGSVFYYPSASGTLQGVGATPVRYSITKYDVGGDVKLGRVFYLYGGFSGDMFKVKTGGPIGQTHAGPYLGFGIHF